MNNILDLNLLLDFENKLLLIRYPNYIDGSSISFFVQHLVIEKKMEFKYLRFDDLNLKISVFQQELKEIIDDIILKDKRFVYCLEFENYN